MKTTARILLVVLFLGLSSALLAWQRNGFGFGGYRGEESPGDSEVKAEWTFARLRYSTRDGAYGGYGDLVALADFAEAAGRRITPRPTASLWKDFAA